MIEGLGSGRMIHVIVQKDKAKNLHSTDYHSTGGMVSRKVELGSSHKLLLGFEPALHRTS
jgi:hypothetical protein